jgi:hypothetical protein
MVATCRVRARTTPPPHLHVRLHVAGWRAGERWRAVFDGHRWEGTSMSHRTERLVAASEALRATPAGPLLPELVGLLPELGLQVVVTPLGKPLLELLEAQDTACGACERAGAALAAVHAAPLPIDAERAVAETRAHLDQVRTAVAELKAAGRAASDVAGMLDCAIPIVAADVERVAPTVKHFSPRRLLVTGEARIAVETFENVHGVHPLRDAAEFLAQLTVAAPGGDARLACGGFRRRYLRAAPGGRNDAATLAAFEVTTLLELAAAQRRRDPETQAVDRLLRAAGERAACLADEDRP